MASPSPESMDRAQSDFPEDGSDILASGSLLKPKLDSIFAEIEMSLPSIDFEISDVSSEEDVPIFHRSLKTPTNDEDEVEDGFLDTASKFDDLRITPELVPTEKQANSTEKLPKELPKNSPMTRGLPKTDIQHAAAQMIQELELDPKSDPFSLLASALEQKARARDANTLPTPRPFRHGNLTDDQRPIVLHDTWVTEEPTIADKLLSEDLSVSIPSPAVSPREEKRKEIPELSPIMQQSKKAKQKKPKENSKGDGVEVVSKYLPSIAPTLPLDNINIDEVVDQTLARLASSQSDLSSLVFCEPAADQDVPSLMQRLAQLSRDQSGTQLNDVDPSSGALKKKGLKNMKTVSNRSVTSEGAGSVVEKSAGTNSKDLPNLPRSRLTPSPPSRKKAEPETVFLDLRSFENEKMEQRESVERVQRVLGIAPDSPDSSSDDDSDPDLWHEQRRKIKESLRTEGGLPAEMLPKAKTDIWQPLNKSSATTQNNLNRKEASENRIHSKTPSTQAKVLPETTKDSPEAVDLKTAEQEKEEEKLKKIEATKRLREQKESERQSRIRLGQRLEAVKPTTSDKGRSPCAEATPTLFDIDASYEPATLTLPFDHTSDVEIVLLSVLLSSSGEMVAHRGGVHRSVDSGVGLSASYTTLITWLLSLVPDQFDFLKSTPESPVVSPSPFHVIGLQQMYLSGELRLYVAVTPVEKFSSKNAPGKAKPKSKRRDEIKDSSPFQKILTKFFSVNTLHSVCPWLQDLISMDVTKGNQGYAEGEFVYRPSLPNITSRPLSTFIQVNPDSQAAMKVFGIPVGFFWQTMESEDLGMDPGLTETDLNYDTQNTMSLIYKKVYSEPCAVMGILNRVLQEGFDLAGLRLLYPTPQLLDMAAKSPALSNMEVKGQSGGQTSLELLNHIGPILAMAIRGTYARSLWLDAVGPSDPALARRTDPYSLCALYGGDTRDECLLFCPRNPNRISCELARWFGGRVPPSGVIDIGTSAGKDRSSYVSKKNKKTASGDAVEDLPTNKPVAMLVSMTTTNIFVTISPLVPIKCLGLLLATCQRRGYQLRGIRRCHLSTKRANSLGLQGATLSVFTGDLPDNSNHDDQAPRSARPSTMLLLEKENSLHSAASLIEAFTVQMSLQGIMGELASSFQGDRDVPMSSGLLFHITPYSDSLLSALGGDFNKVPDIDVGTAPGYITPQLHTNPELEQIVILTLTGHQLLKTFGIFIGHLLGVVPYSKTPALTTLERGLELLGVKWLPSLSLQHAKELTPYEIGDPAWKSSLHKLTSEPAVVLALRGVNSFKILEGFIGSRSGGVTAGSSLGSTKFTLECIMSPTPETAYHQARLFFQDRELYPDLSARWMIRYLPPVTMATGDVQQNSIKPKSSTKDQNSAPTTQCEESIFQTMLSGPRPITTILVCKPDVVQRHLGKLLKRVTHEGFTVVGLRLVTLNDVQATVATPAEDKQDDILSKMHVEYLTSAPSVVLCLLRENAVKKLCDLIGPSEPKQARRMSSGLWRAMFGSDPICNGLHASADHDSAVVERQMFFPDGLCCKETRDLAGQVVCPGRDCTAGLSVYQDRSVEVRDPSERCTESSRTTKSSGNTSKKHVLPVTSLTQTNCILLTPLLLQHEPRSKRFPFIEIIDFMLSKGFELVGGRMLWLTDEQARNVLHLNNAGSFALVPLLRSGPSLVLAVQRDNAIMAFDSLLGSSFQKDSIFAKYGDRIFSSKDTEQAKRLLAYFFDELIPASHMQIVTKSGQ